MSCNKCGSPSSQCGCTSSPCNTPCQPKTSCCNNIVPASATPFYSEAAVCVEDHCQTVVNAAYAASVRVENAFNMPACGMSAQVKITGLISITIGSYLWSQATGYLQVVAFDAYSGLVTVQNNCNVGNAPVGTTIPACSLFVVVDPPQAGTGGSSPTGIFVAIDFTAPNNGTCLLITVTGVTGISVNKNIQIGSGTYRVNSIPDATHLEICNDGAGITPGSAVIAKDGGGNYQYPIVLIDVNPCTNTALLEVALLGCHLGTQQPLIAAMAGMIPVSTGTNNEFKAEFLEVPTRTCATITCCFTILAGNPGPYIVPVSDSSQFIVGDVLQIGTRTDRFTITSIPDLTHIVGTIAPVPGATTDVPPATSICIIDCCEDLQNQVDDINDELAAIPCAPLEMWLNNQSVEVLNTTSNPVVNVGNPAVSPIDTWLNITVQNMSACRNAVVTFYIEASVDGAVSGGDINLQFSLALDIDGGGLNPFRTVNRTLVDSGNGINGIETVNVLTFTLAPLASKSVTMVTSLATGGAAPGSYTVASWLNKLALVGNT